ncbi:hypothetical protein AAE02nite_24690 [Adhaeribacter aerolatus]|uniref:Transposase IS200-like domain-containing protein n=1 Tax=Adhaeribacter aerolatus TaxID=670289 RepID=A0A512AYK8_9BACT|nr:transposase [Adhaeribacter aerolatus]GEO04805.1 hypothetical protein AAE02nite_24690 [Adhaeribacter aerolatus]
MGECDSPQPGSGDGRKKQMAYNPQIHHRRSIRLSGYDYSQAGAYFITLCTHNREHLFGEVVGGTMHLNEYGKIAANEWARTPEIRPQVALDVYVIMPNHMHGILIIHSRDESHSSQTHLPNSHSSQTHSPQSHSANKGESDSPPRSPSDTIGAMVRGYKSAVTKNINLICPGTVVWQRNYYEHIIRNEQAYQTISEYIVNNPSKWNSDKFYSL